MLDMVSFVASGHFEASFACAVCLLTVPASDLLVISELSFNFKSQLDACS